MPTLSKSSFLNGCQCPKQLWMKFHDREAFPPVDAQTQAIFDQGHLIGSLAKTLFPGGIEVAEGRISYAESLAATEPALLERRPLYEAALAFNGGFVRVDILNPVGADAWEIIEVKSGTKVKDVNLLDVAFQKYVCEGAGLKIDRCYLMHVNSDYLRAGEILAAELLHQEDVTEEMGPFLAEVPARLEELKQVAAADQTPDVAIGSHCNSPYECPLQYLCWDFLPEFPVTDLYWDSQGRAWEFLSAGVTDMAEIPTGSDLSAKQEIQRQAVVAGEHQIAPDDIARFLEGLEWPLAFFDLESFQMAVPPYDGLRPYRQIPFQFSVHVQPTRGADLEHHEFLADGPEDPRPAFLAALQRAIPDEGSIVVYNASFEKGVLNACADAFPEYRPWVDSVLPRFVDLLVPFRNFSYYHPDQHGSASIKAVLPAITDTSYDHLEIADGGTASLSFVEMVFGEDTTEERRTEIRANLLAYCALDTKAMVDILAALQTISTT